MTPEITSFNQLFAEAKQRGLTLNSFSQGRREATFFANWRRGDECFDIARHERPFDALRDALLKAIGASPGPAERAIANAVANGVAPSFDDAF